MQTGTHMSVSIPVDHGTVALDAELDIPDNPTGLVILAHDINGHRTSARTRCVADRLIRDGFATLTFHLLTDQEKLHKSNILDINLQATRMRSALIWRAFQPRIRDLPCGLFASGTGGAAALITAAQHPGLVGAVVSCGGRVDLAKAALPRVAAPTLLIVAERDRMGRILNRHAAASMSGDTVLEVVPGATQHFGEPGALDHVAHLAGEWFTRHLAPERQG